MKTLIPLPTCTVVTAGTCRYCGCTDLSGCWPPCYWLDRQHTVCSAVNCHQQAKADRLAGLRVAA